MMCKKVLEEKDMGVEGVGQSLQGLEDIRLEKGPGASPTRGMQPCQALQSFEQRVTR